MRTAATVRRAIAAAALTAGTAVGAIGLTPTPADAAPRTCVEHQVAEEEAFDNWMFWRRVAPDSPFAAHAANLWMRAAERMLAACR